MMVLMLLLEWIMPNFTLSIATKLGSIEKKVSRPKSRYPNPSDLAVAFKRSARESGITNNLHLVDLRPAPQKSEP